jgi:hypothetical protein
LFPFALHVLPCQVPDVCFHVQELTLTLVGPVAVKGSPEATDQTLQLAFAGWQPPLLIVSGTLLPPAEAVTVALWPSVALSG